MREIYNRFRDQVEFFLVYLQEAHSSDGWKSRSNEAEGILIREHQGRDEREAAAKTCSLDLHVPLPILVEEMDNAVDEAYGASPDRLYFIGADGRVAYQGGAGPAFFDLDEWEQAVESYLKSA